MSKLVNNGQLSKDLNDQELNYLLRVLSESRFDGKDVLILAEIVNKLSNKIK